jgi:hypothetical protein
MTQRMTKKHKTMLRIGHELISGPSTLVTSKEQHLLPIIKLIKYDLVHSNIESLIVFGSLHGDGGEHQLSGILVRYSQWNQQADVREKTKWPNVKISFGSVDHLKINLIFLRKIVNDMFYILDSDSATFEEKQIRAFELMVDCEGQKLSIECEASISKDRENVFLKLFEEFKTGYVSFPGHFIDWNEEYKQDLSAISFGSTWRRSVTDKMM